MDLYEFIASLPTVAFLKGIIFGSTLLAVAKVKKYAA